MSLRTATGSLAMATLLTGAAILTLGLVVVARKRATLLTYLFFIITLAASGWLGFFSLVYSASSAKRAIEFARLASAFSSILPAATFHFTTTYIGRRRSLRNGILFCWAFCGTIALLELATPYFVVDVRHFDWGYYPIGSPYNAVWIFVFACILIAAIRLLWRASKTSEGIERRRALSLMVAFAVSMLAMIDFLPSIGIDVLPLGFLAVVAFIAIAAHAIWRYRLIEITQEYAAGQILATMKGSVIVVDLDGRIRVANRAASAMLGYLDEELIGRHIRSIVAPEENLTTGQLLHSLGVYEQNMSWRTAAGARIDILATSSFLRDGNGEPVGIVYAATDVTERRRAEQRLRESEERYRLLFERNLAGVYRSTIEGKILDGNDAIAGMFGYPDRKEFLAQPAYALYKNADERNRLMEQVREHGSLSNVEVLMRRRDGSPVWVIENMTLLEGGILEGTVVDITDLKNAQEQMEYQAYHDVLTGLPNRLLFRDRINIALAHARRHRTAAAVMFLDLDQFKLVNDSLGHTVGDALLQEVGRRLALTIRADDTVARMGGDEFTVLLTDVKSGGSTAFVAQKLLDAISRPMVVEGHELYVTTSIGIARSPEDGTDAETLLKRADGAMYRAKEEGRNNYQFATVNAIQTASDRFLIERSLHHAFERNEFVMHYQPMTNLLTGKVVGAEALIRWNHPERGLMSPDDFIPIAEECGLILPIGEWVLATAVKQMKAWHLDHGPLRIAVNLSARQFQQRDLAATIDRVLTENNYPPELLEVEITESTAMHDAEVSLVAMQKLKEMGVRISIDDFGTGYSSLSYLKSFPIDTVKIDQNFVRDLAEGTNDGAIITAVISMARALNLRVVAEGVETEAQLAFLKQENCEVVQGFLHSRPMPADEFETSLRTKKR